MDTNNFYLRVAYALSGCQLVEQELKLYIAQALELVQKCVADKLPFGMCGDDYANKSLGQLINVFQKLSCNPDLGTALQKFLVERNFLSHKGIAYCLDPDGEVNYVTAREFEDRLADIRHDSERLRANIHEEANKFRGHLWLDDLS